MLLYDVTYPHSRSLDRGVTWDYLRSLAESGKHSGAVATCTNGKARRLVLTGGEWIDHPAD